MKKIIIFLLLVLSINIFAKGQEETSIFIKDRNRVLNHVGITGFSFGLPAVNLGWDYLFNITNNIFIGLTMDNNILPLSLSSCEGTSTTFLNLATIGTNAYFEIYDDKNSSLDIFLEANLMIEGLLSWYDYYFAPSIGILHNNNKFFFRVKYTPIKFENHSEHAINISIGFLIDS